MQCPLDAAAQGIQAHLHLDLRAIQLRRSKDHDE
jgi:hypothetical protein